MRIRLPFVRRSTLQDANLRGDLLGHEVERLREVEVGLTHRLSHERSARRALLAILDRKGLCETLRMEYRPDDFRYVLTLPVATELVRSCKTKAMCDELAEVIGDEAERQCRGSLRQILAGKLQDERKGTGHE